MLSKPTNRRSIATELVLLFTVAAAIVLWCALGGLYWLVVRHAFTEDNEVLADRIRILRAEFHDPDGLKNVVQELKSPVSTAPPAYWVRVLDSGSNVAAEVPRMSKLLPADVFPQPNDSTALIPNDYRTDNRMFSLVTITESINGQPYTIQIAQDRSEDERFRRTFGALLLLTLVVGTAAFAVIATTVTRRGLRPLREMARRVSRVGPAHLHERVTEVGWPREIQPLAAAFDDMLARLHESFTRLSQFSADLAHELRTPIANMLGEAQVALTRARGAEEYREIIESSVAECERLAGIVDNLLFLARSEAANDQIERTVFDGAVALAKIAAFYEPIAEEQQVKITSQANGEIYADPMLFERALNNLVENGLRHTPPGGSVSISMNATPAGSEITVADTGCGISAEHLPHVFDRFYRADSSRSSQGTGLGLAIVKSIVELHGGTVTAHSGKSRGTIVTLTFPRQPTAAAAAGPMVA
jgi:two-component system heavy metal sensor histidine kinase CusS